jgi:hypothetical protein
MTLKTKLKKLQIKKSAQFLPDILLPVCISPDILLPVSGRVFAGRAVADVWESVPGPDRVVLDGHHTHRAGAQNLHQTSGQCSYIKPQVSAPHRTRPSLYCIPPGHHRTAAENLHETPGQYSLVTETVSFHLFDDVFRSTN